ncbi:MAG TPA: PDZ domain-containing protein, partial [Candidatus Binataceae bacterium]
GYAAGDSGEQSMKRNRSPFLVAGACAFAILVLLAEIAVRRADALPDDTYKELATFANVLAIVQKNYVEPVTTKQLINGAITGMLASLDPHSAYLTPDLYRDLEVETRGSFGGLGLEVTVKDDMLTVVAPIEDTPAYKAGVKAGDQIVKINDDFTKGMTLTDAVKRMRGRRAARSA